ncbi:MAG: glycosyltransferase family 2 protein [Chlorobiaceae bacterium]|nr:glycosyltransferase family 2 protein [Chlorobiaceae bacterium]NTW74083.1 glycosyltransferase family 2 protein [Chlorobiaceae bacterium]
MISVIIVSYNTREILRNCLDALYANSSGFEMEVFVIDNDSHDGSASMVARDFPRVHLVANKDNVGFAAANNQAFRLARGNYVVLLNPDAYVKPDSILNGVAFMDGRPDCGLCGGKVLSPEGRLEPSARRFPSPIAKLFTLSGLSARFPGSSFFNRHEFGGFGHDQPIEVDWVPGTFSIVRKEMLDQIGVFDERFYIYYEETDLCLRAKRAGWKICYIPDAAVTHIGGASSKTRKDQTFDSKAAQVQSFRMRSEWLYYRKNKGFAGVLASAGTEWLWYAVRLAKNMLLRSGSSASKREAAVAVMQQIVQSLRDTGFGRVSPVTPW